MHLARSFLAPILGFALVSPCAGQTVINEWIATNRNGIADHDGYASDWIELYNTSDKPQNLHGLFLSDSEKDKRRWCFPSVSIAAHSYLLVYASGKDRRSTTEPLHSNFKLSRKGDKILLVAADGETVLSSVSFGKQRTDSSQGYAQDFEETTLLAADAEGRFLVPRESKKLQWKLRGFDDSGWMQGKGGFGFDKKTYPDLLPWIETDVTRHMRRTNSSAYYRFKFEVAAGAAFDTCVLSARCVSGFVAYLDGVEIARRRAPSKLPFNAKADIDVEPRDPSRPDSFQIPKTVLTTGSHVLAVHALTDAADTREHLIEVEVKAYRASAPVQDGLRFFGKPSPGRPNGKGFAAIAKKPKISVAASLFSTPFQVYLSAKETGTAIRYTLDGSQPGPDSTLYEAPLTIDKTVELHARCFRQGAMPSPSARGAYTRLAQDLSDFDSNIPLVVITTYDRRIRQKEFENAHVHVIDTETGTGTGRRASLLGKPDYSGLGAIKTRGSSTLMRPKKAYGLELRNDDDTDRKASLVGMPKDSDWVLYGPHNFDQSHLRNALAYEIARRMGIKAPRNRFVEVFVNAGKGPVSRSDFKGLYLLVERISHGAHRVDVEPIGPRDLTEPMISGGYILKIDRPGPGDMGFVSDGQRLQHVYPKEREITDPQRAWLKQHFTEFSKALKGKNAGDPDTGYAAWIDVPNFVDYHFFGEYTKNPDAFSLSTYLFKKRGQKIRMGPAWDYDRAMRTNAEDYWVGRAARPRGPTGHTDYGWWAHLLKDPAFMAMYRARARAFFANELKLETIHELIDEIAATIAEAEERDRVRWPIIAAGEWENEIINLHKWIAERSAWLHDEMLETPEFVSSTAAFSPPFTLEIRDGNEGGTLYYTLDGADPRRSDGTVSTRARPYHSPLEIDGPTRIQVRSKVGKAWSHIRWATCVNSIPELAIAEVMFNPAGGRNYEFIEFVNFGTKTIDLRGIELTGTVRFYFSLGDVHSLAPGERCVVVRNRQIFADRYGTEGIRVAGQFLGRISNTEGELVLTGAMRESIGRAHFLDSWFPETDGDGYSLVAIKPGRTTTEKAQWRRSESVFGTPGR